MRTPLFLIPLFALAFAGPLAAAESAPDLPVDGRIKILIYDETDIYTIPTKYGFQTNLVFSADEEIDTISVGDRSLWQIIPAGHRLFIRPMDENVTTNMTIITNKHAYQFDLKSIAADDAETQVVYVGKFIYPEKRRKAKTKIPPPSFMPEMPPPPAPAASPVPAPAASEGPGITQPVNPNYNYSYTGADALAPQQVWDDGKATYLRYQSVDTQPLPAITAVNAKGEQHNALFAVKDNLLVVDEVADKLILTYGSGKVIVYNDLRIPK